MDVLNRHSMAGMMHPRRDQDTRQAVVHLTGQICVRTNPMLILLTHVTES